MESKNSSTKNDPKDKSSDDSWLSGYVVGGLITAVVIGIARVLTEALKKKD